MNTFPFEQARVFLVELAQKHLPAEWFAQAEVLVNLHLREDALAMPRITAEGGKQLRKALSTGKSAEELVALLEVEDAASRRGMLRVMARTHLNRSGINDVSKGYHNKTLSPRIMDFVDTLPIDAIDDQTEFLERWLAFAQSRSGHANAAGGYDQDAIDSFEKLLAASRARKFVARKGEISGVKLYEQCDAAVGWSRLYLGLFTGWQFLHNQNWTAYEKAVDPSLGYSEIDKIIREAQRHICEYAYALSGSFYADLGSTMFVKDDTHVRACCMELLGKERSTRSRVEYVIRSANQLNMAPRVLDKLMYTACSGNFVLLDIALENSAAAKKEFLAYLGSLR